MIEVLTSMCFRLYGRRGARNRALRAVKAAKKAGVDAAAPHRGCAPRIRQISASICASSCRG